MSNVNNKSNFIRSKLSYRYIQMYFWLLTSEAQIELNWIYSLKHILWCIVEHKENTEMLYAIERNPHVYQVHNGRKCFYLDIREIFPYQYWCRGESKTDHKKDTHIASESKLDSNKDRVIIYLQPIFYWYYS